MKNLLLGLGLLCLILTGCSEDNGTPVVPDTDPPQVSITNPVTGAVLKEACEIKVAATDVSGIKNVSIIIDGETTETLTQSPYQLYWNVGYIADGKSHTILAIAEDKAGNKGQSNLINITISSDAEINPVPLFPKIDTIFKDGDSVKFSWNKIIDAVKYELTVTQVSDFTNAISKNVIKKELNDTTYTSTKIESGKYEWSIRGKNGKGLFTKKSQIFKFTKLMSKLPTPKLVEPSNNTKLEKSTNIKLNWEKVSNIAEYQMNYSADSTFATDVKSYTGSDTSYTIPNLSANKYFWRVKAVSDHAEDSDWSKISGFEIVALGIPQLISPANNSSFEVVSELKFNWLGVSKLANYQIAVSTDPNFVVNVNYSLCEDTVYTSKSISTGKHYWRVKAISNDAEDSDWSEVFNYEIESLPAPKLIGPMNNSKFIDVSQLTLYWSGVSELAEYQLSISSDPNFVSDINYYSTKDTIYTLNSIKSGKHYWRVKAVSSYSDDSEWSETFSFEISASTWFVTLDRGLAEWGNDIIETYDGNFVVVGPSFTDKNYYDRDIWINKLDINGNVIWNKVYGGIEHDYGNWVGEASDKTLKVIGGRGETDQIQILSLTSNGALTDAINYGDYSYHSWAFKGVINESDDLIMATEYNGRPTVISFDKNYNVDWRTEFTFESSQDNVSTIIKSHTGGYVGITDNLFVALNSSGSIIDYNSINVYGDLRRIVTVDEDAYIAITDEEILRINKDGYLIWKYSDGNNYYGVVKTDKGFAVCGSSNGEILLLEMDLDKNLLWQKTYVSGDGLALAVTRTGGFVVTGSVGIFGADDSDMFVFKSDSQGNVDQGLLKRGSYSIGITNKINPELPEK